MQSMVKLRMLTAIFVGLLSTSFAADAVPAHKRIVGLWWTPNKDAKLEITERNGIFTGQIIAGKDRQDDKNPDPKLRSRRLVGTVLMKQTKYDGKSMWSGGTFYDPDTGSTYQCKLWLEGDNQLVMRGFIGVSLLGRTVTCDRVAGPNPYVQQEGEPKLYYPPAEKGTKQ